MSKELKAIVLAKCGEIEQGLQDNGWTVIRSPIKEVAQYYFEDESESNFITIDDTLSAYSWQWAATAQILGIQEIKPKLVRDENGYYPVIGGGKLADIFNACKAQLDGPYPSIDGCIATIRRVLRWAQEGIESSNALEQGRNE